MSPGLHPPSHLWCGLCLLALASPVRAWCAQEAETIAAQQAFGAEVVAALRESDNERLRALADEAGLLAEAALRGELARGCADAEGAARAEAIDELVASVLGIYRDVLRDGQLVKVTALEDPDAGKGPVPRRLVLRLEVDCPATQDTLGLLVRSTPDYKLIGLGLGSVKVQQLPEFAQPFPTEVSWPTDVPAERVDSILKLVDQLARGVADAEDEVVVEELQRDPHAAVAGLLHRLLPMAMDPSRDTQVMDRMFAALERLTGRSSAGAPDRVRMLASWLRWHARYGTNFTPMPAEAPLAAAGTEALAKSEPLDEGGGRWAKAANGGEAAPAPPPDEPVPVWQPPERKVAGLDTPAPASSGTTPDKRAILFPDAAELALHQGGRRHLGRDMEASLTPAVRELLNGWAGMLTRTGATLVVPERAEAVVAGGADLDQLSLAADWLDQTWDLLDQVLPAIPGRQPEAVLAVLCDGAALAPEGPLYAGVFEELLVQRLLLAGDADEMRQDPRGYLFRGVPLFVQPTWDMAGNAAAGDDEFRLRNEVHAKFAQCLLTTRCGQMPAQILWGVGFLAEQELAGTAYMFDTTGFVAADDHFGWPQKTRQDLERVRDNEKLVKLVGSADGAGSASTAQRVTWAVLDHLRTTRPEVLSALLADLAALHARSDPGGMLPRFEGDADEVAAALAQRLADLTPEELRDALAPD